MVAAVVWAPNAWKDQKLRGRTAARNKNTIPNTCIAQFHRDRWNCAMHVFGIVFLFLAAVLPLSFWSVDALGAQTTAATIFVLPVLIYWLLLDAALGMGRSE